MEAGFLVEELQEACFFVDVRMDGWCCVGELNEAECSVYK